MSKLQKPCDVPCPKCGSTDIHRQFVRNNQEIEVPFGERDKYDKLPYIGETSSGRPKALRDFILCHCQTCEYAWALRPLKKGERR